MVLLKKAILLGLILLLLFSGCTYFTTYARVDHSDPVIQLAEKECGINKATSEASGCYVRIALENKKPEVCLLANPRTDDWCIQDYYEKRNTVEACEEIKSAKPAVHQNCVDFYAKKKASCDMFSSLEAFRQCLEKYDAETVECIKHSVDQCPETCVVCPPCIVCSSISCQSKEFCESIGFEKSWYTQVRPDAGK